MLAKMPNVEHIMLRRTTFILLILLLGSQLFPTAISSAQDDALPNTHHFDSGTQFSYPDDWTLQAKSTFAILQNGEQYIIVVDHRLLQSTIPDEDDLATLAIAYADTISDGEFVLDEADSESLEIDGREALHWAFEDSNNDPSQLLIIRFTDGAAGLLLYSTVADSEESAPDFEAIAATFDRVELTDSTSSTEVCGIVTVGEESVPLRVGAGESRGMLGYFSSEEPISVLDSLTDDDGNLWWQLDKDQAAPNSAAGEVWIAASDVQTLTDCDADVVAAPSEAAPTSSESVSGNEATTTQIFTDLPPDSLLPEDGVYTATFELMVASCEEDIEPMRETRARQPVQVSVEVLEGGGSIQVGESRLDWLELNTYEGWTDFEFDGQLLPTRFYLRVESETLLVGSIGINFRGNLCSARLPLVIRK